MTDLNQLLDSNRRIYVVATGAGAGLQKILWEVPGISKVLVGAEFPYATEATDRFLGYSPEHYCSTSTAIALALEAYSRAFQPGGAPAVGVGLTASVASLKAHRGAHRVFVATVSDEGCWVYETTLIKGAGSDARQVDGDMSDQIGLTALLEAVDLPGTLTLDKTECSEEALGLLLKHPLRQPSGKHLSAPSNGNGLTLFPGAFNPPHEGHFWMAKEHRAIFHITINPPHKDPLSATQVLQRAKLLEDFPLLITKDDPLYIDKARRFPGARILIGVDALERLLDPQWGVETEPLFQEFRQLGIKLLVADRDLKGKVQTLDDFQVPAGICQRILRPAHHLGMSSSKIREAS